SQKDLLIERLEPYLKKHYHNLHRPHRHSFYHLVLFTKGKGTHSIDFQKFAVTPYQIYFMSPGQVHGWNFEGEVDGYIIHFNEVLFTSFLQNSHYLERYPFFSGNSEEGVCRLPPAVHDDVTKLFESLLEELTEGYTQN